MKFEQIVIQSINKKFINDTIEFYKEYALNNNMNISFSIDSNGWNLIELMYKNN